LEAVRCAAFRVDLQCENGHDWSLWLGQDHGNVYLCARPARILENPSC
jgi:hypothetical protein